MYSRSVQELIASRVSTRAFSKQHLLDQTKIDTLQTFCDSLGPSPFGDKAKFSIIVQSSRSEPRATIKSPGMIKNPQAYIIGSIVQNERCYESYGYLFEQVILKATDLGLATCWLGYFNLPESIITRYKADKTILPAISPIGYPIESQVSRDVLIRSVFRFSRRKAFSDLFFNSSFSIHLDEKSAGKFAIPFEMVRCAPSAGNRQPWRIVLDNDTAHFFIDISHVPPDYRRCSMHLLDIGIAISHFELACRELNIRGHYVSINPESRPTASDDFMYSISWKSH
jgi:hypothetical protein